MQDRRGEAVFAQGIPEDGRIHAQDRNTELRLQFFGDRGRLCRGKEGRSQLLRLRRFSMVSFANSGFPAPC